MRKYIYKDDAGVDDLFQQIKGTVETARSRMISSEDSVEVGHSMGGGIKLPILSSKAKLKKNKTNIKGVSESRAVEVLRGDKVDEVVVYLETIDQLVYVRSAGDICTLNQESLPVYIYGDLKFAKPKWQTDTTLNTTIKYESLNFELDQTSIVEGCSFWTEVFMSASLSKCTEGISE